MTPPLLPTLERVHGLFSKMEHDMNCLGVYLSDSIPDDVKQKRPRESEEGGLLRRVNMDVDESLQSGNITGCIITSIVLTMPSTNKD